MRPAANRNFGNRADGIAGFPRDTAVAGADAKRLLAEDGAGIAP